MFAIVPKNNPAAPLLGIEEDEDESRPDEIVLVEPEFPDEPPEVSGEPAAPVSPAVELSEPVVTEAASEASSVDPLTTISEPEVDSGRVLLPTVTAGPPRTRVVDP